MPTQTFAATTERVVTEAIVPARVKRRGTNEMRKCVLLVFFSSRLFAQITGQPTNLDEHGMRMSNMDGATAQIAAPVAIPSAAVAPLAAKPPVAATLVSSRGYDNNRSGANLKETVLTPANVAGLHKLFSHVMPGDARGAEAQPLIIPAITVVGGDTYDLAVYATMANDVYAFDAGSEQLLWAVHLGRPIVGSKQIDGWMVNQYWGILSTPVYDTETKTLYVVTWAGRNWQTAVHAIHALSVVDGRHVVPALPLTNVSYAPGHGLPVQYFKNSQRKQRASLALAKVGGRKTVFIPFGTIQETAANARGWVVAYDVATNAVSAAWTGAAKYSGAGIWSAGAAPVVDGAGNLYFLTGNGSFDAVTEWGECFVKLHYTPPAGKAAGALAVVDWWSPWSDSARAGGPLDGTHITINKGGGWDDMDLGSGGVTLFPELNVILGAGKDGIGYSLRSTNLGKTVPADFLKSAANYAKVLWTGWLTYYQPATPTPANPMVLNQLYAGRTHHEHATPVWFKDANGYRVFVAGENSNVRAWSINAAGQLAYIGCSAEYASSGIANPPGGMPGMMMAISANGKKNGLVFATSPLGDANKTVTKGYVYAYSASTFGKYSDGSGSMPLLWRSPQYSYNKFNPPVVSGGKLFVPRYDGAVDVFGL